MSLKVGDIDLASEIVELHYQLRRTQLLLDHLLTTNPNLNRPTLEVIENIDNEAIKMLQERFPNMGISRK